MKSIWLDFPVKDLEKSKTFFTDIGFKENQACKDSAFGSFFIGEQNFVMMLSSYPKFKEYAHNEVADPIIGTEVMLNVGVQSKAEVDEMAKRVKDAGGNIFSKPQWWEDWMYGFGFEDPDGHRWNVLYMESEDA